MTVISDEIWSDIILYGNEHIPTQSVSEDAKNQNGCFIRTVKDLQPCRTDRKLSYYIQQTPERQSVKESSLCHYNSMNVLSMHALMGAYTPEGQEWVGELREVIGENCRLCM